MLVFQGVDAAAEKDKSWRENLGARVLKSVIMMAHIQQTDDKSNVEPTYDPKAFMNTRVMRNSETFIHTFIDDQIDSDIIFDDPYVEDNGGKDEHDSNAHDRPNADIESVIYNVQVEAQNQRKMNNEFKKQKALLQRELETLGSKGLNECKNSASNLRGIQVKYIVKEVEDYLKTYSSADMDIR
ncbi:hypothetical protein Tco_0500344, partial [Tanacetum coccineum]